MSYYASVITTTFVPPPDEASVVGYYPSGTDIGTIVCGAGYEFLVSSTYGICCETASRGNCGYRQACNASMVIYEDGSSATCANNNPCVETTIFQSQPRNGWSATMAWCMDPDNPTSIYRSYIGTQLTLVPANSTATTTIDTNSAEPTSTESNNTLDDIPTPTQSTLTTSPSPTSTGSAGAQETNPPSKADHKSSTNVGAIAGGVVGGVAGLALILVALWFILKRQKKKNAQLREIGTGYVAPETK